MSFIVVNTVKGTRDEIDIVVADVRRLDIDGVVRHQAGFRQSRLMLAEDGTEAMLLIEWDSRDHFVAYRQSDAGRKLVEAAMRLHPHIGFYTVVEAHDR